MAHCKMATPFSPFVGHRLNKVASKKRQSQLPSSLIDWDAPEIPELEKERIIHEDYVKQLTEDHEIEKLLEERIFDVAHECIVSEYQTKLSKAEAELKQLKSAEEQVSNERARVNLLLGQIRMFEDNVKDYDARVDTLESELNEQRDLIAKLEAEKQTLTEQGEKLKAEKDSLALERDRLIAENEQMIAEKEEIFAEKENWISEREKLSEERTILQAEIENLNFRNNETACELNLTLENYIQKKNENEELKKDLRAVKSHLAHFRKLAKGKDNLQ